MQRTHRAYDAVKRAMDAVASAAGLLVLAPLLALLALAVRARLGSPVLFVQHRPGRGGRLFRMHKFRTMRPAPSGSDAVAAVATDAERLTRFGARLRAWSLDELPELFNVLRGDMSLVGPRPLLPEYLDRYTQEQRRRHEVRPGITGWAQVNGRNTTSWEERLAMDVWYVDNRSAWLDARILARTAIAVLRREGVSAPGAATMRPFEGGGDGARGEAS